MYSVSLDIKILYLCVPKHQTQNLVQLQKAEGDSLIYGTIFPKQKIRLILEDC